MSTKTCKCGNQCLVLLNTENLKYCVDCHTWIDWNLNEGQKPLLEDERRKEL